MTSQQSQRLAFILADLESLTVRLRQLGLQDAVAMARQLRVEAKREAERRMGRGRRALEQIVEELVA
jgi:hypothetical protein